MKMYLIMAGLILISSGSLLAQKMSMKKPTLQTEPVSRTIVEVSPNPAKDWVDIRINLPDKTGFILELYNENGLRILSNIWDGNGLNISSLSYGIYILCLKRNKEVYTAKMIVDR